MLPVRVHHITTQLSWNITYTDTCIIITIINCCCCCSTGSSPEVQPSTHTLPTWCSPAILSNSSTQQTPLSPSTTAPASNMESPVMASRTTLTVRPAPGFVRGRRGRGHTACKGEGAQEGGGVQGACACVECHLDPMISSGCCTMLLQGGSAICDARIVLLGPHLLRCCRRCTAPWEPQQPPLAAAGSCPGLGLQPAARGRHPFNRGTAMGCTEVITKSATGCWCWRAGVLYAPVPFGKA